jgi:hypothetical protein
VVTTDRSLADTVKATLTSHAVTTFGTCADALSHLLQHPDAPSRFVIMDLQTLRDAEHFIGFLKSSELRGIPIVTIGAPDDYKRLSPKALESLAAKFQAPLSRVELALFAAALRAGQPVAARPGSKLTSETDSDNIGGSQATAA